MTDDDKQSRDNEEAVQAWLWHNGDMPSDAAIIGMMLVWVAQWGLERHNGMDVMASMHCDNINELARAMRDAT
jgi:hypothetical protein